MADAQRIPVLDRASGLAQQYRAVRETTTRLCAPLGADDQMVQSTPEASPTKWHQAHTTWFFETFVLAPHAPAYRAFDPAFRYVFNSYYKQLGDHPFRLNRAFFSRPTLDEVHAYRAHVDSAMLQFIASGIPAETAALITLGLNHEQQHQELILTDIKHAFWAQPLRPAYHARPVEMPFAATPLMWVDYGEGVYDIGSSGQSFCFDNETPRHKVYVQRFQLASRLITNGEYLEFVADGGYRRPELWLSDGWDAVVAQRWDAPLYWERRDDQWFTFTLGGMRELGVHEPVCHISYYEADAFARWAGARLPGEAEWEIAANGTRCDGNLLESERLHPTAAASREPLAQIFGDVWEWTASPYVAYPGFRPAAGVLGEYNGKFMCNQMVLRGGSCVTPRSHIRATYRNFFPPQMRWQFSGLRLAK